MAVGGGLSLAIGCDLRIMAQSAKFVPAFVDLGLVPDMGASWLLAHTLGYDRALNWLISGRSLDSTTALDWGLVNEVVSDDELQDIAMQRAAELAERPTLAIA